MNRLFFIFLPRFRSEIDGNAVIENINLLYLRGFHIIPVGISLKCQRDCKSHDIDTFFDNRIILFCKGFGGLGN